MSNVVASARFHLFSCFSFLLSILVNSHFFTTFLNEAESKRKHFLCRNRQRDKWKAWQLSWILCVVQPADDSASHLENQHPNTDRIFFAITLNNSAFYTSSCSTTCVMPRTVVLVVSSLRNLQCERHARHSKCARE